MTQYEYRVVPAPKKGLKGRGVRGTEAKFANALMDVMNRFGAEGWEYQRTDTLPCEERRGLTSKVTVYQNMLVFRRPLAAEAEQPETPELQATEIEAPSRPLKLASPVLVKDDAPEAEQTQASDDIQDEDVKEPVRLVTKLRARGQQEDSLAANQG